MNDQTRRPNVGGSTETDGVNPRPDLIQTLVTAGAMLAGDGHAEAAGALSAVKAALAEVPTHRLPTARAAIISLTIRGIERDIARTPAGRGGIVSHEPATPGMGGSGTPGDNLLADWRELEAALAAAQERADGLAGIVGQVQDITRDALANADDSEVGWDAEVSASAIHEIVYTDSIEDLVAARDVEAKARAWSEGVAVALNHAIRNRGEITLRLEHLDGDPWVNPYSRRPYVNGSPDRAEGTARG